MKYKMAYPVHASYTAPGVTSISTAYGGRFGVVASYVGAMRADASANVTALYQESVTITGVQFIYNVSLDDENTFKLLNSFGVTGWGNTTDASLNVSVVNVSDLAEVLQTAILAAALGGATSYDPASAAAPGATGTMNNDLNNEVYKQLMVSIQDDGLINSVENQYADTWYSVDASSGAWNTATHYNDAGAQADRDLLFLQIPSDTLNRYIDASDEPLSNALLLAPGDKITFVWDVATHVTATVVNVRDSDTVARTAVAGATNAQAAGYAPPGAPPGVNLTPANVRVAVTMTLAAEGHNDRFAVGAGGLRAV
jgi:hypothetical protein